MNKLAITAAFLMAAASSYAVAQETTELNKHVYSVKMSFKTTKANVSQNGVFTYRTITSKTINGFYCVPIGNRFDDGEGIILGYDGYPLESYVGWNNVVRIGKNNTEIEADAEVHSGDVMLNLMAFGAYDVKNERVSSLNGTVIATLPAPELDGYPVRGYDLTDPDQVPTDEDMDEGADATTIAFGTISVKYSLEASKKEYAMDNAETEEEYVAAMEWFARKMGIDMMR